MQAPSNGSIHPGPAAAHVLTYIEFYSGIGGWTLALQKACRDYYSGVNIDIETSDAGATSSRDDTSRNNRQKLTMKRLASYDHSDLCNAVFEHNFIDAAANETPNASTSRPKAKKRNRPSNNENGSKCTTIRPPQASSLPSFPIEKLTVADLARMNALLWAMSPPCQPHTRQHDKQQDELDDPRSKSFLHLMQLLDDMQPEDQPKVILLENVIGFEMSASCRKYMDVLERNGYAWAEFHLSPPQVRLLNDRPRYYCVAIKNENNTCTNSRIDAEKKDDITADHIVADKLKMMLNHENKEEIPKLYTSLVPLHVLDLNDIDQRSQPTSSQPVDTISAYLDDDLPPISYASTKTTHTGKLEHLQISSATMSKSSSWCFDVVTASEMRSTACFTSSYGKYVKGTGSILWSGPEKEGIESFRLVDPSDRSYDSGWWEKLTKKAGTSQPQLRYFSGTEVARFMGFPLKRKSNQHGPNCDGTLIEEFSFPSWCTEKQKFRLLGNSINIVVSARMAEMAIRMLNADCI